MTRTPPITQQPETEPIRQSELPSAPVLLSVKSEIAIRIVSTVAVLLVFTSALILSWNGLTQLASQAGFPASYAWLMPLAIYGMVVAGGLNVLQSSLTRQSTKFGWLLIILGSGLSIWGNMTAFQDEGLFTTEAIIHGIAPVSMVLSLEALLRILRGRIHVAQAKNDKVEQERTKLVEAARKQEETARRRQEKKERASRLPPSRPRNAPHVP